MSKFCNNIKTVFQTKPVNNRGEFASTIVVSAIFVIAALIATGWIATAIINKGADVAACIENASAKGISEADAKTKCSDSFHKEKNSFTNDAEYKSRFGK